MSKADFPAFQVRTLQDGGDGKTATVKGLRKKPQAFHCRLQR